MASAVDISNLALGHLGEEALVTSLTAPDSFAAEKCAQFYPIARDMLLELHAWGFATYRVVLGDVTAAYAPPAFFAFTYTLPALLLRALNVYAGSTTSSSGTVYSDNSTLIAVPYDDSTSEDYLIEMVETGGKVLYTNVDDAYLRYIKQVVDTTKYTPSFVVALSHLLASMIAGPIIKGKTGVNLGAAQFKAFETARDMATRLDSNARRADRYAGFKPAWIANR